jgi:hypothetical protein
MSMRLLSRRAFVKATGAGAAGTLVSRTAGGMGAPLGTREKTQPSRLTELSLAEASELLRTRKASPVELTEACLSRIEALNPKLNAFITVMAESALAQAREAEAALQKGRTRGPLHGIPIALKDLADTNGVRTTRPADYSRTAFPPRMPRSSAASGRPGPCYWAS